MDKINLYEALQLDRVAFYGRTLCEYLEMFNINLSEWKGCKILDCPAGASSFVAESSKHGVYAVGCDPLFGRDLETLVTLGKADIEHVMDRVSRVLHLYNWDFYTSPDILKEYRLVALHKFAEDYPAGATEGRYIGAALPILPFKDNSFHLILSGHFLFTYSDKFDYSFHLDSILEMFRVCSKELRIYPIQGPDAQPYEYLDELLCDLEKRGAVVTLLSVSFEFQRGSNHVLCLKKEAG